MSGSESEDKKEPWYPELGTGSSDRLMRIWAPYRMSYINDSGSSNSGDASSVKPADPFVEAPKKSDDDALIVARGKHVYCLLNLYPYNSGHMLIVPYRKVGELEDLHPEESSEFMDFAQLAVRTLKRVSRPTGINLGMNLGHASGGSIRNHLHMHVVPRWPGDANFMTVMSGTKVLPQLLEQTRSLLAQGWAEITHERNGQDAEANHHGA